MAYIEVTADVDISDYIDEFSTSELVNEIVRRKSKGGSRDIKLDELDLSLLEMIRINSKLTIIEADKIILFLAKEFPQLL